MQPEIGFNLSFFGRNEYNPFNKKSIGAIFILN
jgi:hypothetical protein